MSIVCDIRNWDIRDLEREFSTFAESDPREAAEIAFAIACFYHQAGPGCGSKAKKWGLKSIELFELCDTSTEVKCVPLYEVIGHVHMPNLIHEGVVLTRMHRWGLME